MVDRTLFSPLWYRVANLRPRLLRHAQLHRQHFRGELWYVLQDHAAGKFYRFSPAAHVLIGMMDGRRTIQEIWDIACNRLGDGLPTQDEVIRLLSQLHSADMIHSDIPPDVVEIAERASTQRRKRLIQSIRNPLAVRIPLVDPDRFLAATYPLISIWFTWFGLLIWLGVVGYGVVLAGMHWPALTENITDRVLATDNLVMLFLTYPFVKALHELGHGYAIKAWGGEVHQVGVMMIVLMPIPYVDATAAWSYQEKRKRIVVGAAGIMVELMLAALAMMVWVNVGKGFVSALAFNVMLIGGVSTLLFNGNPLLRFDGYYVFADLIEIPNLGVRGNKYMGYLFRRYLFGVTDAKSPATARNEAPWLLIYSIAAFIYRTIIMLGIILMIAGKFFFIGVLLAVWALFMLFVWPLCKQVAYLFTAPELTRKRKRALTVSAALVAIVAGPLFFAPVPFGTVTQGVIWVPENSRIRAGTDGVVAEVMRSSETIVQAGELLVAMKDPLLEAEARIIEAELAELRLQYAAEKITDQIAAKITRRRIEAVETKLARAEYKLLALKITSPTTGRLVLAREQDLVGHYVRQGEQIGYVVEHDRPIVRAIVDQDDIELVRSRTSRIDVRLSEDIGTVIPAAIRRQVPRASNRPPSLALTTRGGGLYPIDPADPRGETMLESVFQIDLKLLQADPMATAGGRVYVRFDHEEEAVGRQLYRRWRQLLLGRFNF